MPLARYGVLAGRVVDRKAEGGTDSPHDQVQVAADGELFRVAVNVLASGDAVRIPLGPPVALGNRWGLITLLDPDGLKVDGVAYTKPQADTEGWTLVF